MTESSLVHCSGVIYHMIHEKGPIYIKRGIFGLWTDIGMWVRFAITPQCVVLLLRHTRMPALFSALATVLERPSIEAVGRSIREAPSRVRRAMATADFVTSEGLGLSSLESSQSEQSDASMNGEAVHSRDKDKGATVAMAGAFLAGVFGFSRLDDEDDVGTSHRFLKERA